MNETLITTRSTFSRSSTSTMTMLFIFLPIVVLIGTVACYEPITPPNRIDDEPRIANGRVYFLDHIPKHCRPPIIDKFPGGRVIKDNRALLRIDSPHKIRGNIEVAPTGCLYIEPGTELRFGAGFGIIVNGTLIARGSEYPGERITMTKLSEENLGAVSGDWQDDARLSMGNTTRDGRLDLKYGGLWRAICTNYNNFTKVDANVTCRHLGFLKGNFTYHSYAQNLTDYILWEKPACRGSENSLFDCPGVGSIRTGRHICDGQQVIGFSCEGLRPGLALDHWRGIDFYNTTHHGRYQIQDSSAVYMQESDSFLEYLDISYTGLDTFHGQTDELDVFYQKAAISASPYVPRINNVTIRYGAYDGFNLTEVTSPIWIANSTISHNRGYGMFIQSSVGHTLVNMTEVHHNWGDGIKFYISNLTIFNFRTKFPPEKSFCQQANTPGQYFPVYEHLDLIQVAGNRRSKLPLAGSCTREFIVEEGKRLTIHFHIMERDPAASGSFVLEDGGRILDTIPIENGSFPQSITTKSRMLAITLDSKHPPDKRCKDFPPCIRFLIEITAGDDVDEEFRLLQSSVHNNTGYGVNIQDIRSKVRISNRTIISDNQFGAGLRIFRGAGEIIVNGTRLEGNADAGINITYAGGFQLINNTECVANKGYGIITEYLKVNNTRIEKENRVEVVRSSFKWNELIGLRMGNYCRGGDIKINESYFGYNYDEAFEYLSCNISTDTDTKLRIEFNEFDNNFRHAIFMHPFLNTRGVIQNNTFENHTLAVLRIDNGYNLLLSEWYRNFSVNLNIFENKFHRNSGRYAIYLRLTQNSAKQQIHCKFNNFEHNQINDSFMYLNPRSRANAVVVVSSSNVKFIRNFIENPDSVREVSTHLVDPSVTIDASENYWGFEINQHSQFEKVYQSIFDQNNRYNLARIKYYPALRTSRFYENYLTDVPPYIWRFSRPGNIIGGELESGQFRGKRGQTYYVDRDIFIHPNVILYMEPGSKLKFGSSVGMVVHGILRADGEREETPVVFDMDDREEFVPMENRTASVRLVDGATEFEGRLEVEIDGQWGTVCHDGWIEENALLVCQQLGLSYNRANPTITRRVRAREATPILMNWVSCTEVDVDLTRCRAVNADTASCTHDQDVFLRCQPPTWAGITLAGAYRLDQQQPDRSESQIRHVQVLRAGLLDPETASTTPALRIDYNFYQISYLTVQHSVSDGVHVYYSNPYTPNRMEYLSLTDNEENGLVTHSPHILVNYSRIERNKKVGFMYDPFLTQYDALLIRSMIHPRRRVDIFSGSSTKVVENGHMMFLTSSAGTVYENKEYTIQIQARSFSYRLTLQVLDYLPVESLEKVIVYDSSLAGIRDSNTKVWEIEKDLVDFPIVSSSRTLTIKVKVNGLLSGRLTFAAISISSASAPPRLLTKVSNTFITGNDQGVVTKHYNSPSNKRLELFFRHREEEIQFNYLTVLDNRGHAMHMPSVTKFHEDYIPTYEDMTKPERVAVIKYTVTNSKFLRNGAGIVAEHNHVDFANNVWQWSLYKLTVENCRRGGVEIEVPRVNDQEMEREQGITHAVHVKDCVFRNNFDFVFTIAGYFADVDISLNRFESNQCLVGVISLSGMEKRLNFESNSIENNIARYALDMDILSHSKYSADVKGVITTNSILGNYYDGPTLPGSEYAPKTYTIAIKGLQNVRINTNIFSNRQFDYELVAGVTALSLENHMDVQRNYWGYEDESSVRRRIFDFEDWNNYAIADYWPYFEQDRLDAAPTTGEKAEVRLDHVYLGGIVERSWTLSETGRPFIVYADLTIMPNVVLKIPPGAELQFRPNVGILVLGRIIANGLPFSRIKMKPLEDQSLLPQSLFPHVAANGRKKRNAGDPLVRLRGDGELFKNAGFLEMYNASSNSWNLMCDSQFNEKTAEVVCRELGKETVNVRVRFTHLYDHYIEGKPMYFRKEFWYNSYHCRGDETKLDHCIKRYNYNLQSCVYAANYTFITCGDRNLERGREYWGNIRFSNSFMEEKALEADKGLPRSSMSYVDIEGAGILHGQKVGAIQTTYVTPNFKYINITKCADNGYDIVAPRQDLIIDTQNISNNLGYGVNVLILNGESRDDKSSFLPSGPSTIPYNVYGLVDVCSMEKEITISTRIIVFYKYGPNYRDCVKIIKAKNSFNRVGVRLLQINLFQEDFSLNTVEFYDGQEARMADRLAGIVANSSQDAVLQRYDSTGDTLSIHMHASVGHESYGFIAEVVKLPFSGLTFPNSEYSHTVQHAEIRGNQAGAIRYKNVGEVNPSLFIEHCFIYQNGYPILNLTSPPSIDISLQSTVSFRMSHNQISYNKGGFYLYAHTSSINTALNGNVTNNVFAFGSHGEAINISGHYFPRVMLHQNYIYNYTSGDFRDIIHVKDVVVNFTQNYILRNLGHYILNVYSNEDSTTPQLYDRNGIYDNNSTALVQSTIKISQGAPKFSNNYLVNTLNDFEMESYPKMHSDQKHIPAKNNWWGSERRVFISGKIFDKFDEKSLTEIDFWPSIIDNRSLVEGTCPPGWVLNKGRCYRYMGGALPYREAEAFCQSHKAFLAEARGKEGFFNFLMKLYVINQDWADRVWVMSDVGPGRCSAFERKYVVTEEDCQRRYYPFICETDPSLALPSELEASIKAMIIGISVGVGGVIMIIIIVILVLWSLKSKRREKERFERTASIRSSLNNLNKIGGSLRGTKSTLTMLSEGQSRRRLNEFDERSMASTMKNSHSQSSAVSNGFGSTYSINSGYGVEMNPTPAATLPAAARITQRDDTGRPVHSLRPDRSGGRRVNNNYNTNDRERDERERRERERQKREEYEAQERRRRRQQQRRREEDEDEDDYSSEGRGKHDYSSEEEDSIKKSDYSSEEEDDDDASEEEDEYRVHDNSRGLDESDARNMQYKVHRSHEHLLENRAGPKQAEALKPKSGFGRRNRSRENVSELDQDYGGASAQPIPPKPSSGGKQQPFSSFAQPVDPSEPPVRNIHVAFPRSDSREDDLPTPPPDPRRRQFGSASNMLDNYNNPKPDIKPKPIPSSSSRDDLRGPPSRASPVPSSHQPAPLPRGGVGGRQKPMGSQERLYKNTPDYDQVYDGDGDERGSKSSSRDQFPRYNNMAASSAGGLPPPPLSSDQGSNQSRLPIYDPVYDDGFRSDHSRSTDKYEPVDYNYNPRNDDQQEQLPEMDYLPRQPQPQSAFGMGNPALGRSRERLGPPPAAPPAPIPRTTEPRRYRMESDIDSYAPSIQSDIDYMPRNQSFQPSRNDNTRNYNANDSFHDPLPPKPGAPLPPPSSVSSLSHPGGGSRDNLNSVPIVQPPPYEEEEGNAAARYMPRALSRENLDNAPAPLHDHHRSSRERLDDLPPPYSPGEDLMPRPLRGSRDVLYLGTGARPKQNHPHQQLNESLETEI